MIWYSIMPRLLELFSGTGSVGSIARGLGWEVTSLDINPKSHADIHTDILTWDYADHDVQYDFIWASPPCTEYSIAKTVGVRNLELADSIVRRTWEIIDHFQPRLGYVMENPQTGMLKSRPMMVGKPYTDIDYCKYGMPYRKRTRLWNNIQHLYWKPRPLCKRDCESMKDGTKRHLQVAQRGPKTKDRSWQNPHKQAELYRVPGLLIHEILTSVHPINIHPHVGDLNMNMVTLEFAEL
jgi:hypothetical protein